MLIEPGCVVALSWRLMDGQGDVLDETSEPVELYVGGEDLLPKLQELLIGKAAGFELHAHLEPEDAFGDYKAEWVCFEDRALFPEPIEPGMQFETLPEGAKTQLEGQEGVLTVTEVYPEHVVLDANHPLAGMALNVNLRVLAVRQADEAERARQSTGEGWSLTPVAARPDDAPLH